MFPQSAHGKYRLEKPITGFKNHLEPRPRDAKEGDRFRVLRDALITKQLVETGAGDEMIMGIAGRVSRRMLSRYA